MIQIALVGETPQVVEEGIRKNVPEKLFILHTKNESRYKFQDVAKRLKRKIVSEYQIPTELVMVGAYGTEDVIKKILNIIANERKRSKSLERSDFAINITGGTKAMVAAASTASYIAGSRLYYVLNPEQARGTDMVLELPVPSIPRNDSRGNTTKTTSIVLQFIGKLGKTNNSLLLHKLQDSRKVTKLTPQKLYYHLQKLEANNLITITRGWVYGTNPGTGQPRINMTRTTIELTVQGEYYAEFPDLVGNIV